MQEQKMNRVNYQKELEKVLQKNSAENRVPSLLLHACCAPCSSYCLEYLNRYFQITVFFYNPNIDDAAEYAHRKAELLRLIRKMPLEREVSVLEAPYDSSVFLQIAKGLEQEKEGGARCKRCFALRLEETAKTAAAGGFDYFTTTLTISPLKNAALLNEIGQAAAEKYQVSFLPSDFKKNNGYLRSIALSKEYGLYRQNYCGCSFSKGQSLD